MKNRGLKLALVCLLCLGLVAGLVFLLKLF